MLLFICSCIHIWVFVLGGIVAGMLSFSLVVVIIIMAAVVVMITLRKKFTSKKVHFLSSTEWQVRVSTKLNSIIALSPNQ